MATPKRADRQPVVSLARDLGTIAENVRQLREQVVAAGLPARLVKTTVEQRPGGEVRIGFTNTATGNTAWLTDWF